MKLYKYLVGIYLIINFNQQFCMDHENTTCSILSEIEQLPLLDGQHICHFDYAIKIKLILAYFDKVTNAKLNYEEEYFNTIFYLSSKRKKIYVQYHQLLFGETTKYTIAILKGIFKDKGYKKLSWLISSQNELEQKFFLSLGAIQRQNFGRQIEMEFDLTNATENNEINDDQKIIKEFLIEVVGDAIKKCNY